MKTIWQEARALFAQKAYRICMIFTAIMTYGTLILHPTVGIDDTAWKVYYIDGVSAVMGRWVLHVINEIFPIATYNPYIVEGSFMCLFVLSVTMWVILFKRIIGNRVSDWTYIVFGCAFLASPITSEVITYYLSNGISIAFGFTALSVWFLWSSFEEKGKNRFLNIIYSALWLWLALGCYESFIIVYMVAICLLYLFKRGLDGKEAVASIPKVIVNTFIAGVSCILWRSVWIELFIVLFSLQSQVGILQFRGITDILLRVFEEGNLKELENIFKAFFIKYYVNASVYKPITLLVLGYGFIGLWALVRTIKKKDIILLLAAFGAMIVPWLLPILEGYTTYYRTSQYIVLVNAAMVFAVALLFDKLRLKKWGRVAGAFLAVVLLYNEMHEMNYWLKLDQDKYEDACRTADMVAYEIIKDYDETLPICVVGKYSVPSALASRSYCPLWSKKYMIAETIINIIDKDMLASYLGPHGYRFAETPLLSILDWGTWAFFNTDVELVKFWESRGFDFEEDRDIEHYDYARELLKQGMPSWPEEGSIIQMDGYIIVNLDNSGR